MRVIQYMYGVIWKEAEIAYTIALMVVSLETFV